jgi:hypothetical protein
MRIRLLLIVAILLLAIPLGFLLRDVTRDIFLMELLRMARGARLLFESVAQTSVWIGFLALALLLALASLIRRGDPSQPAPETEIERPGPIHGLVERIEYAANVDYFRRRLAYDLRTLTLEVLAHQHRTTAEQMRQHLDAGTLAAPEEIQAYLRAKPSPDAARSRGLLSRLKQWLSSGMRAGASDPELERVVQFLESQLMREPAGDRAAPGKAPGREEA